MMGISSESVKRQAKTKANEQAHSDLCIGMSEQMRSERATRLSESIRFETSNAHTLFKQLKSVLIQNEDGMFRAMEYFRCSNEVPTMEHKVSSHQLEARSILLRCPANRINPALTKR